MIQDARDHIDYEENVVWPQVRRLLMAGKLERMGEKIASAKKLAPTRPHPHTPPRPSVLKTAGTMAAITDKARDAVTRRGRTSNTD